ncbi:MAG: hypothetical protein M0O96_02355 [Desulforhopalus sp.]|nr:hypothetical protein [Desulforhopalus sp.]
MWNIIVFALLGIFAIVFQTAVMHDLPSWFGRPDFLFILLVFISYRFAWIPGLALVFTLSWMMDVETGVSLGFYPLICLLVFTVLKLVASGKQVKEATYQIPLLGVAWLVARFIFHLLDMFTGWLMLPDWEILQTIEESVLLMIIAIPLFALYNNVYVYVQERSIRARASRSTRRPRRPMRRM